MFILYTIECEKSSGLKSFADYRKQKSQQWKGYTSKKMRWNKQKDVIISIGMMQWRESKLKLMCIRGKRINLEVSNMAKQSEIRILAERKWKSYHPDLYNDDCFYSLLYESGQEIENLPGSDKPFSLNLYQAEIGKDYKRITFYLCNENDLKVANKLDDISEKDSYEDPGEELLMVWNDKISTEVSNLTTLHEKGKNNPEVNLGTMNSSNTSDLIKKGKYI